MQEEVTQKTIALYVKVGKGAARLTEQALQKAIQKFLEQKSKPAHGKQTMRQLMKQNAGVSNIEITDSNIKAFESTAKKYNIDFSLKKVKGEQTRYKNENGAECYYVEFLQDDVAFVISSENISAEDYAKCLQALVNKTQQNSNSVHTITGEIIAIDPYANHIGIRLDEDKALKYSRGYGIDLPDGQSADGYSLGDRVEITYTGEPATVLTIWAEQLVDSLLMFHNIGAGSDERYNSIPQTVIIYGVIIGLLVLMILHAIKRYDFRITVGGKQ